MSCAFDMVDGMSLATLWCSEALKWFATKTRFGHETRPEKSSRADIRCTRLQMALRVFLVSTEILGLQRFGGQARSSVFIVPKLTIPGQV